jgi:hypothetical protein
VRPGRRDLAGEFFRQPQQRVGRRGHHVLRHVDQPSSSRARRATEQVERIARTDPVSFGEDADGLLDLDARGQRVL